MRVATWNVNSIKARLSYLLRWLAVREPDVVCLQELKLPDESFPHAVLRAAGYHCYVHGQPRWNGVAVLSREPGEVVQVGLPGMAAAGARLVTVAVGDLTVTSVYVPNGKHLDHADFAVKLGWLHTLGERLGDGMGGSGRALVGGDFNVVPSDADSHDPDGLRGAIFHTEVERSALDRLLGRGWMDLCREAHPDGRMFSWWDYRGGSFHKNEGLRIDLLLGTPEVRRATTDVWVDREYRKKQNGETPSDHAPVIAEIGALSSGRSA